MQIEFEGKRIEIGRILGGIAWPGEKPGCAVVIGEEALPEIGNRVYHLHLLEETEKLESGQLIRQCIDLKREYPDLEFIGRNDEGNRRFLDLWNNERRGPEFFVYSPPGPSEDYIQYYLTILLDKLQPERTTLHLPKESKLPGYLLEIPQNEIRVATNSQYPAVAALGYAVATLTEIPINEYENEGESHIWESQRSGLTGY